MSLVGIENAGAFAVFEAGDGVFRVCIGVIEGMYDGVAFNFRHYFGEF